MQMKNSGKFSPSVHFVGKWENSECSIKTKFALKIIYENSASPTRKA
jgi:hypothetical protein